MNTGFIDASVNLITEELTVDITSQEIDTDVMSQEIPVDLETQELTVDLSDNQLNVELENKHNIDIELSPNYDMINNKEKDVNFYDYDGTLVASYYASDFLLLKQMPSNPKGHPDLVPQGWNWTFEEARNYVLKYGKCDIGQIYTTYDGTTKIYIDLPEYLLHPYLGLKINGTINVDWGDGTQEEITGTGGVVLTPHVYQQDGSYVISINCLDAEVTTVYSLDATYHDIAKLITGNENRNGAYQRCVKKVFFGPNITLTPNCLNNFVLEAISISNETKFNGNKHFNNFWISHINMPINSSYSIFPVLLKSVCLPEKFDNRSFSTNHLNFKECRLLHKLIIPENTILDDSCCYACNNLKECILPETISSIPLSAFMGSALTEINLRNISMLDSQAFRSCAYIKSVKIAGPLTYIGALTFYQCTHLLFVTFDTPNLQIISGACFDGCVNAISYDFTKLTTIPSLQDSSVFYNIPSDCQIIVPDSLYEEWINATNWSALSDHIVKESDYNG